MVLECVDSYMHWAATKQQLYLVSTATLQNLACSSGLVGWSNDMQKNFSPVSGGTTIGCKREGERWLMYMYMYNNKFVAETRAQKTS